MIQNNWSPEKPYCVYLHTTPKGKVYVGQTCQRLLCRRFGCGGKRYINAPVFYKAIQKYGWDNIKHEIVKDGLIKNEANQLERELITKYRTTCGVYNLTDGGEGTVGRPCSAETRQKIGAANKGKHHKFTAEQRAAVSKGLLGKKHTPERKLKNRLSHIGQPANNKGKILIHKNDKQIYIKLIDLDKYIADGWIRGSRESTRKKYMNRWKNMSEASKNNIREAQRNRIVTMDERIKKSKSHIKHGKYVNPNLL